MKIKEKERNRAFELTDIGSLLFGGEREATKGKKRKNIPFLPSVCLFAVGKPSNTPFANYVNQSDNPEQEGVEAFQVEWDEEEQEPEGFVYDEKTLAGSADFIVEQMEVYQVAA